MNKRTFLAIALLFATFAQVRAADAAVTPEVVVIVQAGADAATPAAPTLLDRAQSLVSAVAAAPQAGWNEFTNEPVVQFVVDKIASAKDAVVNGVGTAGSTVLAAPSATAAFVKANPISLTLAALTVGYVGYRYATACKSAAKRK